MATIASDLNIDLLIKMMGMTQSDNDNQAMVALRKANAMIAKVDGGWDALLRSRVTVIADPFGGEVAPPQPADNGWRPHIRPASRPAPTPPPPVNFPEPPRNYGTYDYTNAIWDSHTGHWIIAPTRSKPPPAPPKPAPQQTTGATVVFTKRAGEWILKSDLKLVESLDVSVSRKDGKLSHERVGTLIHNDATGWYYNIYGKTNFSPISSLSI